ncbi:MAG TPA: ABC transporter ATP-binding protein [Polyangiaceae bacterium]|jgi:ABC-type nitrate/sulfonate/bicarbonate transport system ATPase subunit|nr:ABC transporter ATP-binding protein [Polyangiaceae bacterium]
MGPEPTRPQVPGPPLLEAIDLTLAYGGARGEIRTAVHDVRLTVNRGDFVCLLGPSGCGKTSLLKAFGGFLPASGGRVLYRGQAIAGPRREIIMVFQEHNLYPWLNVEDNVAFGPRRQGVPRAEVKRRVDELLETVGLASARRLHPHELSGGMRQRVAIARALATQPDALLLDEPFTALDAPLRRKLQKFLRELWRRTHTAMLMVTHDIEEAILVGQRIVVMGGSPAGVVETVDTSDESLKDRFSPRFLELEARLETRMGGDDGETPASARPASSAMEPALALAATTDEA